jgi:hypothetical protein
MQIRAVSQAELGRENPASHPGSAELIPENIPTHPELIPTHPLLRIASASTRNPVAPSPPLPRHASAPPHRHPSPIFPPARRSSSPARLPAPSHPQPAALHPAAPPLPVQALPGTTKSQSPPWRSVAPWSVQAERGSSLYLARRPSPTTDDCRRRPLSSTCA